MQKFNVGDRVRIRPDIHIDRDNPGRVTPTMLKFRGKSTIITLCDTGYYKLKNCEGYWWHESLLESTHIPMVKTGETYVPYSTNMIGGEYKCMSLTMKAF